MKWSEYYGKFYDWSESTQMNRISSLTDFGSLEEVCEIVANFNEKGASKLIRKARHCGVQFHAEDIMLLSEFIEKELLSTLITECKYTFTATQLLYIQDHSLIWLEEIQTLISNKINFEHLTWEEYYDNFHELSDEDKLRGGLAVDNFTVNREAVEIIFYVVQLKNSEQFIFKALDYGVVLQTSEVIDLIMFDNKKLNKRLVFEHLDRLIKEFGIGNLNILENYMYAEDFMKIKGSIGNTGAIVEKPKKVDFLTKLGASLLGLKILDDIFKDTETPTPKGVGFLTTK